MDASMFFRRPWLTGLCAGGMLAFVAYLPSVASAPLPWYRVAAVFGIGWLTFWFIAAGIRRSSEIARPVCGACAAEWGIERATDRSCPHETLLQVADAFGVTGEGRRLITEVVRSLTPQEAHDAALGTAEAFIERLGITAGDLHTATGRGSAVTRRK